MEKLILSTLSLPILKQWVNLNEYGIADYDWLNVEAISLSETEQQELQRLRLRLLNHRTLLMNEATIWARGIYPLLLLAEQGNIEAWAGVAMRATYPQFEIEGIADGVLGKCVSGFIETPYLIVVEAKRGLEAQNPVYQLYGQLLVAAHLNWENNPEEPQEIFGCYTIADSWSFIRAEVNGMMADRPSMQIESSRQYAEQYDAETIAKILKGIVSKYVNPASN
ncbi:hypothetical protein THII_1078 [Thioploca ingrica]|uniref:Uncharacterized protein n=1 Tax=Thioploca ingrica TaxID=40754 RepID=A0A090AK58_9GAMM|nr:hypothetical protein THII_1078 [Thioploca ingrica]